MMPRGQHEPIMSGKSDGMLHVVVFCPLGLGRVNVEPCARPEIPAVVVSLDVHALPPTTSGVPPAKSLEELNRTLNRTNAAHDVRASTRTRSRRPK